MGVNMRPEENDYNPYYKNYIAKVTGDDPVTAMEEGIREIKDFFNNVGEVKAGKPYGEGKWTYKETLGHIIDSERVMAYRSLCIARGETKPLPGFEQDDYVKNGNFNQMSLDKLIEEYAAVRHSSILLFRSFSPDVMNNRGIANEFPVTVLALGFIIAGHELHHLSVLKDYYQRNL
jgi:hypothetical protein